MKPLHPFLVFLPLNGQGFGLGSVSGRVRVLAFLKTIRHLVPFVAGTRAQGYVVRIILKSPVQVLLEWSSVVTCVVEDQDDGMKPRIRCALSSQS